MSDALFWMYLANAVMLITHEIDSAYREEWKLFRLPGGITGFLLLHVPLVALVLYGLVEVSRGSHAGLAFSLALSLAGVSAFAIHMAFLRRGHNEFRTGISLFVLAAMLVLSVLQMTLAIRVLFF